MAVINALHLHFNEWSFVDSSGQNKPVINTGVTIAASAGVFDGADYLQVAKANVLTPVIENNWEVDLIVDHSSLTGTQTYYSQYEDSNNRCHLQHINGTGIEFLFRYGGVDLISLTGTEITDSNEHHIALTKEDDTFRLFLDGVLVDSDTYFFGNELIDSDIFIGQDGNSANYLIASMRNFRIGNITRFINTFSPDFSYDIDTDENTHLLSTLFLSAGDNSQSGLSVWNPTQVTRGNVDTGLRIYRFGNQCGFFPGTQYGFAPYSLQLPDHPNWNIGDRDFTLDTWLYPLSHFNYAGIMHQNTRWYWYVDSAGKLNFYVEDGPSTFSMQTAGAVPLDEWSHAALTRIPEYRPPVNPTFDPDYTSSSIALSNGNLTAAYIAGANVSSYATDPGIAGGKYYWEVHIDVNSAWYHYVGCCETRTNLIRFGNEAVGYAYRGDGNKYTNGTPSAYGASYTTNDVIGVALDLDNGKIFFSKNGVYQNSGDPVAGTNPAFSSLNAASHYPAIGFYYGPNQSTIRFQSASFSYSPPTGYEPLAFAGGNKQIWRMYIKGIKEVQKEQDFTIPNLTGPMWIGRGTGTSDLYYGYMDELRLLLNKAVWTEDEFWPWDYPYFDEGIVHRYRRMHRRRIHSIQGR